MQPNELTCSTRLLRQELIDQDQIDSPVVVDQFGQLLVVGRFDQFVDELAGQGVADSVAGFGGQGAQRYQQVTFAGAGITDEAQGVSCLDPGAGGQLSDDGGVDGRVGVKGELLQPFWSGKTGVADAAFGAAAGAVIAFGDHQLGQKP
jgi:hypothetical protein